MTNKTLDFSKRHIGLKDSDVEHILHDLGYQNVDTFFKDLVPGSIYNLDNLDLPEPMDESSALKKLNSISKENRVFNCFRGQG